MGERCPQNIQNLVLRDYCQKINCEYLLSGTEYAMQNSYLMLQQVIDEMPGIDGIVFYSLFQMPETQKQIDYVRGLYEGWTYALHPATNNIDHDNLRLRKLVAPLVKWGFSPYEI